ncbi:hypothetical protein [Streptomyces sp. SAS_270]|uniref:hypothetical protein n=1 Tax=Streptomyces sp. SAS_270 TaxID=3412748 RepID=UPI00403CD9A1
MSNQQPYDGYEGYDGAGGYEGSGGPGGYEGYDPYQHPQHQQPYQPQPHPQQGQQQQQPYQPPQEPGWPGQQQGYDDPSQQHQYTQQWEGQTWETQTQAQQPPAAADTAYLPPQGYAEPYGAAAHSLPPEAPTPQWTPEHAQAAHQAPGADGFAHAHSARPGGTTPGVHSGAAAEEGADPGYGPATTTGNTRVTDAQRARAEGRSPIIEPGIQPAALTAVLGLLLAVAAPVGEYALAVPLVLLQAVTAAGWFRLNGMWPARQGIALAFAGALTADVALLAAGREHAPAAILGTLGVWVLLTLVLQLRSHADPDTRMSGLMATVASAALAIVAAGHLAADPDAVSVGAAAVAVAVLARALPLPTPASVVVALLAASGAGIAVGGMTDLGTQGAFLGLGAGVCALVGHRVASYDYPSRFVHFTAGVALPLAAAAPAIYVLGRALG